jgi:hypothetical protein
MLFHYLMCYSFYFFGVSGAVGIGLPLAATSASKAISSFREIEW